MTGARSGAPPGDERSPQSETEGTLKITATRSDLSVTQAAGDVPQSRPWARRPEAHDVEIRYRRSVYYWRRRQRTEPDTKPCPWCGR